MSRYVARKRARLKSGGKKVNIPWGTVLEEQGGFLIYQGKRLCAVTSQNAHDYFSLDDDGQGYLRGVLVDAIISTLEKRDADYQARWDKIWDSPLCKHYKRPEPADFWIWHHNFYEAPVFDLWQIARLIGAKVRVL